MQGGDPSLAGSDPSTVLLSSANADASGAWEGFPPRLGFYRREHPLGRGGMGLVCRYRDTKLDRLVAVKALPPPFAQDPQWRDQFTREAKALASLDHANIAKIHHVVEHAGADFLILEYVPGRTLAGELADGPLPLARALSVALHVARAIEAGHGVNVIHSDIKPGNLMVTPTGTVKLLDYGLARLRSALGSSTAALMGAVELPVPGAGQVAGTPGYMSPEQTRGERVDERTDVWGFGCVLFECLAGVPAFRGASSKERLAAAMHHEPDWERLGRDAPLAIRQLLARCLTRDPEERLSEIGEACGILQQAIDRLERDAHVGSVATNLPKPLTSFISRQGELEQLEVLMAASRLLTLTGTGGCGKTRLARELAARTVGQPPGKSNPLHFPDGVWFVELAPLANADLVPQAVASVLRVSPRLQQAPRSSMTESLIEELQSRKLLLVLDNCEHLVASCGELVGELLHQCPDVHVIATSRERLGVDGEQTYDVPALSFPVRPSIVDATAYEAVRLFVTRASLVRPDFELTERSAEAVTEICRRLGGIPLAIELAAARVRSLSVEEISQRLFEVLDPGRVLESSIAWSIELLLPAERTMLGRLSVFRGGWSLEAAETVCANRGRRAGGSSIIDRLTRLVDKSLVVYEERHDRARYHMLETVRDYCRRRLLRPGSATTARRRHLAYFLRLVRAAYAHFEDEQAAWLNRLEAEHDNLRAALEHSGTAGVSRTCGARLATGMSMLWRMRGYFLEGRHWFDQVLARCPRKRDVVQLRALNAAGNVAWCQRDFGSAKSYYEEALAIARERGDRRRSGGILTNLGLLAQEQVELTASRRLHEQAMAIYDELNDGSGVAMVQLNLGVVAKLEGKFEEARRLLDQSVSVFRQRGDWERVGGALRNLGEVACRQGAHDDGVQLLRRGLEVIRQLRDKKETASAMLWIAMARQKQGFTEHAARIVAAAQALREDVGCAASPEDVDAYECCREEFHRQLDEAVLRELSREGRAMTYDKAVAYAISEVPDGVSVGTPSALAPMEKGESLR